MKILPRVFAAFSLAAILQPAMAQTNDGFSSNLDASLRLGVELQSEPDFDIGLRSYASRVRWGAAADINEDSKLIGYLDFGFDQQDGVILTRQAWAGISAGFGTVTAGTQHSAFYDAVTSRVDIAYVGSCLGNLACATQPALVKYAMAEGGNFQLLASLGLVTSDPENDEITDENFDDDRDIIDTLDIAAKLNVEKLDLSGGLIYRAENNGVDRGFALGAAAATDIGAGVVSAAIEYASDDFLNSEDDAFGITTAFEGNNLYGLFGISRAENTPFFLTAGYVMPVIQDLGLIFFEVGLVDADEEGSDTEFQARSALIFNFGAASTSDKSDLIFPVNYEKSK